MNREYFYFNDYADNKLLPSAAYSDLKYVPLLNSEHMLLDVIQVDGSQQPSSLPNVVVIMAGGKGTRLHPYTLDCPKPMLPIAGKPMLHILLDQCISYGFDHIYISVNYLKEQIIDYFGDGSRFGVKIEYLVEEIPLGTAGSLQLIPVVPNVPFLVMNGDVLTQLDFRHLLQYHNEHKSDATICAREDQFQLPFGVVKHSDSNFIAIEEKPITKYLVNAGVYVLGPEILKLIQTNTYLDMPTLLTKAKETGYKVNVCPLHEYWIDVGRPESLKQAHLDWGNDT